MLLALILIILTSHCYSVNCFKRNFSSRHHILTGQYESQREPSDVSGDNELEIELDRANKANAETTKAIKRAAANLLEVDTACCEEAKARADIQDQSGMAERKG